MFAASKSAKAAAAGGGGTVTDPQINYVTTLLTGDGTNGQQNSTFVDSSANNATVTGYGNVTQGSAAPFGSNWSNYFNGSTDCISVPDSTVFTMGAGDFTLECWVNLNSISGSQMLIGTCDAAGSTSSMSFVLNVSSGTPRVGVGYGGVVYYATAASAITVGQWYHIAGVRNGANIYVYVNGVQSTALNMSTFAITDSSQVVAIGRNGAYNGEYTNGQISNVRIVKGTAVYTANFTPSTTPLTAITNTSLLTCQSPYFKDNSANAFAITVAGTPSVQRFSPFSPATAYDSAVYGGSMYFDGAGDYLSIPASAGTDFGTGNFTVEMWINPSSLSSYNMLYSVSSGSGYLCLIWGATTSVFGLNAYNGVELLNSSASTTPINQWTHIAFVRSSGTLYFYINGVASGSGAFGSAFGGSTGTVSIAYNPAYAGSYYTNAGISNLRVVKGTAVYTANFTPPTAPATAITNTQLLLKGINAGIYDSAMQTVFETAGNAQVSTTQKKYGTGSVYFDGTGDCLVAPAGQQFNFGTSDFTYEAWIYPTSFSSVRAIISFANTNVFYLNTSGIPYYGIYNVSDTAIGSTAVALNAWSHIAFVRSGTTLTCYINGTSVGSITTASSIGTSIDVNYIGAHQNGNYWLGYLDDFRITKGYARYTTNFTPPAAALPTS